MTKPMKQIIASGFETKVGTALAPQGQSGIAFSADEGSLTIAITRDGEGLCVRLDGDEIDYVAGLLADMVHAATLQDQPVARSIQ
ncbi:hypothetical protein SAMN02927924_01346 [Sphingobium faniae]|nr:hypothetical protein SAMN02927924_01346 [Sphingobium faniae]